MIDDLVRFYRENIMSYSLVYKYMKFTYGFSKYSIFNVLISALLLIVNLAMTLSFNNIFFIIYFIFSIILFLWSPYLVNKRAKTILRKKHSILANEKIWKTKEYDDMRNKKMIIYLKKNDLYTEKKLDKMKELLKKKSAATKLPPLLAPGLTLAFIGPVWVEFIKFTFSKNIATRTDAALFTAAMCVIVLFLIITFSFGRYLTKTIREIFSTSDSILMEYLIEYLDEIQLLLPREASKSN